MKKFFLSDKSYILLQPLLPSDLLAEFASCLQQLEKILKTDKLTRDAVVRQTVFMAVGTPPEYRQQLSLLKNRLREFYDAELPPTAFVGQPPANGLKCAMEIVLIYPRVAGGKLKRKTAGDIAYTVIEYREAKELYAGGLTGSATPGETEESARQAFDQMALILRTEGMSPGEVVRQWNYIEKILDRHPTPEGFRQNYQIFNDIRSAYYSRDDFVNGYPAATGIGMQAGGVILEFIAVTRTPRVTVIPIKNPLQINAYSYSQEVLVGPPVDEISGKTSPKFERAKLVAIGNYGQVYISGTAAIRGQTSVSQQSAVVQTQITLENIQQLISEANSEVQKISPRFISPRLAYMRVYIKDPRQVEEVKAVCKKYFPAIPALYLISDICRNELLVEIEGVATWQ